MPLYKFTGSEPIDTFSNINSDFRLSGKVGHVRPDEKVSLKDLIRVYQIESGSQIGRFVYKSGLFVLVPPPPPPVEEPDLPPTTPPVPAPLPTGLWIVRGDEELAEFGYKSRTAAEGWNYLRQTPSVFRFDKFPVQRPTEYRVDITPMREETYRINGGNRRMVDGYLFADGTALFNRTGFPRLQYLTMSFNLLQGIAIESGCLKFRTLKPNADTSILTPQEHPWFVHRWDLVTMRDGATVHVNTPHGNVYWFLTTVDGYGYIPLRWVRPYPYGEE